MRKSLLGFIIAASMLAAGSGCSFFEEMRGVDQESIEKEKEKKEKAQDEKKEKSYIPPEVASGLNDTEKEEMEAVYKKIDSDSKATSKRVFGGFLP
jgi:hypothetical protein